MLTTCSLAELAAAARRAVAAIGHDANQRFGTRKVFLAAVHAALGGEGAIDLEAFKIPAKARAPGTTSGYLPPEFV